MSSKVENSLDLDIMSLVCESLYYSVIKVVYTYYIIGFLTRRKFSLQVKGAFS